MQAHSYWETECLRCSEKDTFRVNFYFGDEHKYDLVPIGDDYVIFTSHLGELPEEWLEENLLWGIGWIDCPHCRKDFWVAIKLVGWTLDSFTYHPDRLPNNPDRILRSSPVNPRTPTAELSSCRFCGRRELSIQIFDCYQAARVFCSFCSQEETFQLSSDGKPSEILYQETFVYLCGQGIVGGQSSPYSLDTSSQENLLLKAIRFFRRS